MGLWFRVEGLGFAPRHRFSDRARQLPLAPARAGVAFGAWGVGGPCQNHNNVRVPKAYDYQSIHAKIIITFVFLKHTIARASIPKSK